MRKIFLPAFLLLSIALTSVSAQENDNDQYFESVNNNNGIGIEQIIFKTRPLGFFVQSIDFSSEVIFKQSRFSLEPGYVYNSKSAFDFMDGFLGHPPRIQDDNFKNSNTVYLGLNYMYSNRSIVFWDMKLRYTRSYVNFNNGTEQTMGGFQITGGFGVKSDKLFSWENNTGLAIVPMSGGSPVCLIFEFKFGINIL